ncbi:MAG: winged helix-turn-helix domain-containing protein [Methylobacteriaceae bacterium]|nr:winged helix-turn-helix domain-containing protein [Methylobacteriaceae bacterium]
MASASTGRDRQPAAFAEQGGHAGLPRAPAELSFSFGPFRLLPDQLLLLRDERPVHLGSRAFALLKAFVEHAGELLDREMLAARAWPGLSIEESNLRAQIAALRRALGEDTASNSYVMTVPGRGYRFVAPVTRSSSTMPRVESPNPQPRLPRRLTRLIGRSDVVAMICGRLRLRRFLTIVGPGGIGKTTVALAVASELMSSYADGVAFVDLAPLREPRLVPHALVSALGLDIRSEGPSPALNSYLRDKRMLLLFDNCEHVVEAAARLAEDVLKAAPGVHILATSREPLGAQDERLQRLLPLETAPVSAELTAVEAFAFPAVQLFVERAAAGGEAYGLTDADAPIVAQICQRMDGIALAIELAAGRVDAFGVRGVAAQLDDRFHLLTSGRRTAFPRHQTLRAALDWSNDLLAEPERRIFRRLAIFAGRFTLEAGSTIAGGAEISEPDTAELVASLVSKSLVTADFGVATVYYRLLDTTRSYALTKLHDSGEWGHLARRHAEYFLATLSRAEVAWHQRPAAEWLGEHRHLIDNVRTALAWAFSADGEAALGVALTIAAVPLWFHMSLLGECSEWVERALGASAGDSDRAREMQLRATQAWSLMLSRGPVERTQTAWMAALGLAEKLGDTDYQLRSLWGLWAVFLNHAQLREAMQIAKRFCRLAARSSDPSDAAVGDRLVGHIQHLMGKQNNARIRIERMLSTYAVPHTGAGIVRFIFDQQLIARCTLARIMWLQGLPDQATTTMESAIAEAKANNDMLTLGQALLHAACPISIFIGDLQGLQSLVATLADFSSRNAMGFWGAWSRCFEGVYLIKSGDLHGGLTRLDGGLGQLREMHQAVSYVVFLWEFAEALGDAGEVHRGLAGIDEALALCRRHKVNWCIPEMLRVKGDLLLKGGGARAEEAAELFRESLVWSHRQDSPSWGLRTSTSLFRLWRDQGRAEAARNLLQSAYDRFSEGFASRDLVVARDLLREAS